MKNSSIHMKKFVSLISGGLDSPVAAYLMIKKGFIPIFLSFLTSDDENHSLKEKTIRIIQILRKFVNKSIKLYLVPHDPILEQIKKNGERKLTCVLCKRTMIRVAKLIGSREKTNIIVTGDILGEQASQTLDNLFSYNNILKDYILLRPLIGFDKLEVIKIIEKIGLYEICSQTSASCQHNPQYPETHAKIEEVNIAENQVELENLIEQSLLNTEILDF